METLKVPRDTVLQAPSQPLYFKGGRRGVLLLHGFTGVPADMRFLAETLNRNDYTVAVPRLPGHGTNTKDFLATSWKDWLRRAVDAYLDLSYECEKVYVGGLSMGGVLTLIIASMFEVEKIVLAAPAIVTYSKLLRWTPLLRLFIQHGAAQPIDTYEDPGYRALAPYYWQYERPAAAASLYRLQKIATRRLHLIEADALTIVSEKDESVPTRAADIIERGIRSSRHERVTLKESGHVLVNGVEREVVAAAFLDWLRPS